MAAAAAQTANAAMARTSVAVATVSRIATPLVCQLPPLLPTTSNCLAEAW